LDLKARKYNTKIKLYTTASAPDGYGGRTTTTQELAEVYARRENYKKNPFFTDGLKIDQKKVVFYIRNYHITSDMFVVYKGFKYDIEDIDYTQLQSQMKLICVNTGFEV